ncbi:MAG TPA: DciA family protein [Methylophilaceae bacterium]|nr:DciA family protein [Methylophilaceae bacterium]
MQRFSTLFRDNPDLAALSGQASSLTASQTIWNTIVPENLKPYTQAGNVKHKRLTVYTENGAVAAKIKLLLPSLLTKLQKLHLEKQVVEVTSIRVEVQVQSSVQKTPKHLRSISAEAASSLNQLAQKLSNSEPGSKLGEILARLSGRT